MNKIHDATPKDADDLAQALESRKHLQRQARAIAASMRKMEKRNRELLEDVIHYAREAHIASTEKAHNRLEMEDCNHPDCVRALAKWREAQS